MTITPATRADRETLIALYLALLEHLEQFGCDTPPTLAAAQYMVEGMFLPAVDRGDPVLIARTEDSRLEGEPVGAVFWCRAPAMPGMRATAVGYGTYVIPACRRTGVGRALRDHAIARLREQGVRRIVGMALNGNAAAHASLRAFGMKPSSTIYEMTL